MPKALTTVCKASRPSAVARYCQPHVWISDDLLTDTLETFAHNHKRHGSNVPGPLEARRRAAKRRATTLANISHPVHPNTAIMMRSSPQSGWWHQPDISGGDSNKPSISSWLFGLPHRPPPTPKVADHLQEEPRQLLSELEILAMSSVDTIKTRLSKLSTHSGLLEVFENSSIGIAQHPDLAKAVVMSMIDCGWKFDEVEKCLLDPRTNPSGSLTICHVFEHGDTNLIKMLLERDVLIKAARLGLVSAIDLQKIVFHPIMRGAASFEPYTDSAAFLNALLDALELSNVIKLNDLDADFVKKWLRSMHGRNGRNGRLFHPTTAQLLWRLCSYREARIASDPRVLVQVISKSLRMIDQGSIHNIRFLVEFILSQPRESANIAMHKTTQRLVSNVDQSQVDLVTDFQTSTADALYRTRLVAEAQALQSSDKLNDPSHSRAASGASKTYAVPVVQAQNETLVSREPSLLDIWYAVLAGVGSHPTTEFVMDTKILKEFIYDNSTTRDDPRRRIVLGLWSAMALSVTNDKALADLRTDNFSQDLFHAYVRECTNRNEDVLASIVKQLSHSILPAKNKLLHRICTFSDGQLFVHSSYWELLTCLTPLDQCELSVLRDKTTYKRIRRHFPQKLSNLSESLNDNMQKFEDACKTIILDTRGSVSIVLRLLAHNEELKFALRHASTMPFWRTRGVAVEDNAVEATAVGQYNYRQIVNMIDKFAWACATSAHLSDRNAFRFTWWLCMYLHVHGAPVSRSMLKAVWHAGVLRNKKHSYHVVKMIYARVVEYEGETLAQEFVREAERYHGSRWECIGDGVDSLGVREGFDVSLDRYGKRSPWSRG